MSASLDRLYDLLPVVYRERDFAQGYPLRALLRVIAEQVQVVEDDIARLYDNWFIETCDDWAVPYLGDLIGYRPVHEAGEPGDARDPEELLRNKILVPRREVANTLRYRSRKGTLALLELLARDVAGWPARAVEFRKLIAGAQGTNHLRLERGRSADLRLGDALDRADGPFDELAHTAELRRLASHRRAGRYGVPAVGLFLWRLRAYSVTRTSAYGLEEVGPHAYAFSVLGNDAPLYVRPLPEPDPNAIAGELDVPGPIRRRDFERRKEDYYGEGKSLMIWVGAAEKPGSSETVLKPVTADQIVVADLTGWQYRPKKGQVAIDPRLGRIAFSPRELPKRGVWVSYHYGFSADIGGGEYDRPLSQPAGATVYRVEKGHRLGAALDDWRKDKPLHAVIEIAESGVHVEQIDIELDEGQSLQIRAANRQRAVLRLLDWQTSQPDSLSVKGAKGSAFTLDGLLVTGRSVSIAGDLASVAIRHSTLVPGWGIDAHCKPRRPAEPSLELYDVHGCVSIEHSILGSIQVNLDEVEADPVPIRISDSVLDATSNEREAVGAPTWPLAHARLTILRSTVFGQVLTHAIDLAENSLFGGLIRVGRRQIGCMRYCSYVPGSRTPRRYRCQPDLVKESERERVRPRFESTLYGSPVYCRLADDCADEIRRGADDESEMGVFHDLFQPQREANLRARLDEYTPAGLDAGLIFAT
jgi:hypothetical protein